MDVGPGSEQLENNVKGRSFQRLRIHRIHRKFTEACTISHIALGCIQVGPREGQTNTQAFNHRQNNGYTISQWQRQTLQETGFKQACLF